MKRTIFPPKRAMLPATSTAQTDYVVKSEDEMRAAISAITAANGVLDPDFRIPKTASRIVIGAPFSVRGPVTIPIGCPGLVITSAGRIPLRALGVVDSLFIIYAAFVTIRDLFVVAETAVDMFTTFVTMPADCVDASFTNVVDNFVLTDRLYVEETGADASGLVVRGNRQNDINGTHGSSIVTHSSGGSIMQNALSGGPTAIEVAAGGGFISIVGNSMNGGDIITTASNGFNILASNPEPGTFTLHADDIDDDL